MNIVVPMAGRSTGFLRSKFKFPRFGVSLNGISILDRSLRGFGEANYFFICLKDHFYKYHLGKIILRSYPKAKILLVDVNTQGQACSALWADEFVGNDDPLLIVSPMQLIRWDPADFMAFCDNTQCDAAMVASSMLTSDSELFYTKVDFDLGVVRAVSDTYRDDWMFDCGVYYFKYGWYFMQWTKQMIDRNARVGPEFWVAMCMNDGLIAGKTIRPYLVDEAAILRRAKDVRDFAKRFPHWSRP